MNILMIGLLVESAAVCYKAVILLMLVSLFDFAPICEHVLFLALVLW